MGLGARLQRRSSFLRHSLLMKVAWTQAPPLRVIALEEERGGGVEEGRDGGGEEGAEGSEYCLPLGSPVCISLRSTPFFKTTTFMEVVSNWEGGREGGRMQVAVYISSNRWWQAAELTSSGRMVKSCSAAAVKLEFCGS